MPAIYDPHNWYFIVNDHNPATEVYASARFVYVPQVSDSAYLAFVNDGNTPVVCGTESEMLLGQQALPRWAMPIRAATFSNITPNGLVGGLPFDTITLVNGDIVALCGTTSGTVANSLNGIYRVTPSGGVRALDYLGSWFDIFSGRSFQPTQGTYAGLLIGYTVSGSTPALFDTFAIGGKVLISTQDRANVDIQGGTIKNTQLGTATGVGACTIYAVDNKFTLLDNVDVTKKGVFELSGVTALAQRTLTWPDADGTIALVGVSAAPVGAEYITSSANASLTAERVATDTTSITWDFATAAQAKANVNLAASFVWTGNHTFSKANPNVVVRDTGTSYAYISIVGSFGGTAASTRIGTEATSSGGNLFIGTSANASVFGSQQNWPIEFATNNNVRARIANSGEVSVLSSTAATSKTTGAFIVAGGIGVSGDVFAGSLSVIGSSASVTYGTRDTGGNWVGYVAAGVFRIWQNVDYFLFSTSSLAVNPTTASTSPTSGALVVQGGVGVAGAVYSGAHIQSTSPSAGIGYATGAGGTVTQTTNINTTVTLDKTVGLITTVSSTLAANTETSFTLSNAQFASGTDLLLLTVHNYTGAGSPGVRAVSAGYPNITIILRNYHASAALNAAVQIRFAIIRGAIS